MAGPLRSHLAPYTRKYVTMVVASFIASSAEACALYLLVALATTVARSGGGGALAIPSLPGLSHLTVTQLLVIGGLMLAIRAGAAVAASIISSQISSSYEEDWKQVLFRGFLQADWPTQSQQLSGSFQNLLITDVEMSRAALEAVGRGLVALTSFVMMLVFAFVVNAGAALVVVGAVLGLALVVRPLARRVQRAAHTQAALRAEQADEVVQTVALAREIQTFGVTDHFTDRMDRLLASCAVLRRRIEVTNGAVGVVYQTTVLGTAFVGLGLVYRLNPELLTSAGPVVLLLLRSLTYSQTMQATWHSLHSFASHLQRIDDERALLDGAARDAGGLDVGAVDEVRMEAVGFAYATGPMVLHEVDLGVRRGEILGLIGPSGGGKSTLVQLLLRLRIPTSGALLVNGEPADAISLVSWSEHVAFLPQEPVLLNDTLEANIRFGRPGLSGDAIRQAAVAAGIDDEIRSLPNGYEEVVGEGGRRLSGGQRQRVCFARALAGRPDVLVVDEPTSSLDAHSEHAVRQALADARGSMAVVVVAHRLSTLDVCDRIAVVVDGTIEAIAPPHLLEPASRYFRSIGRLALAEEAR